ncbi:adenylate cyclase [Leptolyngbya sp. 'hensonii']|uniref:adenylate/guanylate cyclase domain-containing protein n=1 Tax=Leptolyngbya sp. 'hensonii' TaxID=1922337 RepID=UPI00094F75DB|nr:adenylate/guanylate cyclase domain-containing protein [Leptolyngbya sp. 'hensonii']OLP19104.1 adenylate cyclase [Leptolyngbya sp. 'hensonii']
MPFLICYSETDNSQTFTLLPGVNTIGREQNNHISISDVGRSVSRYHAEIDVADDHSTVRDLQSSNHTFVNGAQVQQWNLQDGDMIRFGNVACKFVLTLPAPDLAPEVLPSETENFSIVRRISPEQSRIEIRQLLEQSMPQGTALKLRQDQTQRNTDKLRILLEVGKELSAPGSLDGLLEKILNLLFEIMAVDRAVILLVNDATGRLERKAVKSRFGNPSEDILYSTQIAELVLQQGDAILTNDARLDQRFDTTESILQQAIRASMCVPLQTSESTIGVLYVDNQSQAYVFAEEDLDFLIAMGNQAAIAISNTRLSQKMQAEAVMRAKLERFFPRAVSQQIQREEDLKIVETEVTALFSDITGFTQMAASMEPRQILELLNEYFTVMVEDIVFHYAGTLEKYIADALLAVWGSPYRQADDAKRAVEAAIEMQQAMQRLNQQRNLQWQIHIGLNTGKVAAGNIGSRQLIQYTHIGDTMNVASRICNVAGASEILISQATLDSLGNWQPPVEFLPPTSVKGKDQPLQLYRVLWQEINLKTL